MGRGWHRRSARSAWPMTGGSLPSTRRGWTGPGAMQGETLRRTHVCGRLAGRIAASLTGRAVPCTRTDLTPTIAPLSSAANRDKSSRETCEQPRSGHQPGCRRGFGARHSGTKHAAFGCGSGRDCEQVWQRSPRARHSAEQIRMSGISDVKEGTKTGTRVKFGGCGGLEKKSPPPPHHHPPPPLPTPRPLLVVSPQLAAPAAGHPTLGGGRPPDRGDTLVRIVIGFADANP